MINELSILIPCYNSRCLNMVEALSVLLKEGGDRGLRYELIVADDGSTDSTCIEHNKAINMLDNCRYVIRGKNVGRAAIRNFLAQEAQYEWLLFLDCDMVIDNRRFIENYLHADGDVVVGGIKIGGDANALRNNIRYKYEKASERLHTAEQRRRKSDKEFRTTNFLINKKVIEAHPFNEKFVYYGYEDVLMGKTLNEHNIGIRHIDNPVLLDDYEDNETFINKTEESLRTLSRFENELQGYSTLLGCTNKIERMHMLRLIKTAYKIAGKAIRRNLTSNKPRLFLFNIYKLLYYISLS